MPAGPTIPDLLWHGHEPPAVIQLLAVAFPTSYGGWMVRCTRALVRMIGIVLRLVMACTIATALTGQPSNLTSVRFWALAEMLTWLVTPRTRPPAPPATGPR